MTPQPFRLSVPEADLADLRERLARTRWPDEPPMAPWSTGASLEYMKGLVAYWRDGFDWRAQEARLNALPQYKLAIDGIVLHFIHIPSKKPGALPLLLSHGWPGSVLEFMQLIPLLTERFSLVLPSLPGYTLSYAPGQRRLAIEEIADLYAKLMSELGYDRFGAQGGDWGGFVASCLGHRHPRRIAGIHLNFLAVRREPDLAAAHPAYQAELANFLREETGYQWIQGTKPQTLAYGLTDSPAGLAAWIAEKFRSWTDCDGTIENAVSRDALLAGISLYWFTGAIGSSFWPYYARMHGPWPIPAGEKVTVPTGYVEFPKEIIRPPREVAEKTYSDIRRWTIEKNGGHFAAMEQPLVLAREIRAFFEEL